MPAKGPADLEALCREHAAAHDRREDCKARLAEADEELDRIESELAKLLHDQGTDSIKSDRWVLSPKLRTDWKVVEGSKDQVVQILKVHVPELVKETVNHSSLNSYLNKKGGSLDTESPLWWQQLKPVLEVHQTLTLSMRQR